MTLEQWQKLAHKAIRENAGAASVFHEAANLRAYAQSFPHTVHGTLEEDFPLLRRLVGAEAFRVAVNAWLAQPRGYFIEVRALAPAFLRFLEERGEPAPVLRAARLDIFAEQARIAPEPRNGSGRVFGLHPSVRLLSEAGRLYCVWRQEGSVCRERLSAEEHALLSCFARPAELAEISESLERSGLAAAYVREAVGVWTASGVIASVEG